MTLDGLICIRNGLAFDYCFVEAIQSLLPVCDRVIVCDGESTDGTQELLREWLTREPKLVLCVYPWPHPVGDITFWTDWLNYAREHCAADRILQLDADEILGETAYQPIRDYTRFGVHPSGCPLSQLSTLNPQPPFTLCFDRLNFYKDTRQLIPSGVCLSNRVYRYGPQNVWLPSDGPDPRGAEWVGMGVQTSLPIFHYGYLRRPTAFFEKSRDLQKFFFNSYDPRLVEAEKEGREWMAKIQNVEWRDNLIPYDGPHPAIIQPWLKERGYTP